jgi:hypothetical protein
MRYKQIIRESKKKSLPGAPSGVQIMTPQQFVANQSEESDVTEAKPSEESTLWRVEQSGATGRYFVVKGYQKRKVWKNSFGSGDFISKDSAQKKAEELNHEQRVKEGKLGATAALAGAIALGGAMGYKHATKDPNAEPSAFKTKHQHAFDAGKNLKKKIAGDQKNEGVAAGSLNEFAQGDFNGGDGSNDLHLYLSVAKKLNMKRYKPSTANNLIAKKMAELVDVVDDDKVDWARHMVRKEQGLPNMLDQHGLSEGFFDIVQGLKNTLDNRQKLIAAAKLKRLSADFEQRKKQRKQRELAAASTHKWDPNAYDTTAKRGAINGVAEATKLAAPSRPIGDKELTDYLDRIRGVPDIDKKTGLPKVDKKGKEKYISGKTKQDKFRMPYIHRNSVMRYYSPDGKVYNTDLMKDEMKQRPPKLLKQNEKMKHSNGELEQFFNIGFAALVGAAIDESTNEVIIVNTCPGAGACMVDCFEMKGGFIQYEAGWLSRSKILTYLLNDPEGFSNQLNAEIAKEARAGAKGGYSVSVRWHNSGDFFSPEYIQLAFDIAKANPTVKFYAYTKIAAAALADKPKNFIINWSEGAKIGQEKQIKAQDPNLERTKNSRIVPENLFWDLLKKDDKGNLDKEGADDKGAGGRWVMRDQAATMELKKRLAQKYGLSVSSILDYDEYMTKRNSIPTGMKYNVIVAPGEGDVSANDHGVLSTLLLRH